MMRKPCTNDEEKKRLESPKTDKADPWNQDYKNKSKKK